MPTLALNFASNDTTFLRSFYQFALAPEDEARAIAAAAIAAGAKTAVAFVPSNQRGYEIRDSFRVAFEDSADGELLDWYGYEPALQDFSQPTAALLNVTRSRQRHQRLAANLGVPVQFPEARHREDVDMIFVVAFDSQPGRLLASQLRFYGAGDIPVYATPQVFDPGPHDARQRSQRFHLRGYAGAALARQRRDDRARRGAGVLAAAHGPARFYGMGADAYALIAPVVRERGQPVVAARHVGRSVVGRAGTRSARSLPLAQFRNGRPVTLDAPPAQPVDSRRLIGQR